MNKRAHDLHSSPRGRAARGLDGTRRPPLLPFQWTSPDPCAVNFASVVSSTEPEDARDSDSASGDRSTGAVRGRYRGKWTERSGKTFPAALATNSLTARPGALVALGRHRKQVRPRFRATLHLAVSPIERFTVDQFDSLGFTKELATFQPTTRLETPAIGRLGNFVLPTTMPLRRSKKRFGQFAEVEGIIIVSGAIESLPIWRSRIKRLRMFLRHG